MRRLVGYGRLDGLRAVEGLGRLYTASRLFVNFCERGAIGIQMASRSVGALVDPAETAASCEILAKDLLAAVG